jgi:hypothetical protein
MHSNRFAIVLAEHLEESSSALAVVLHPAQLVRRRRALLPFASRLEQAAVPRNE